MTNRPKIIATISPHTPMLRGVDLIRLNGAFGTFAEKSRLREKFDRPVIVDIPGARVKHRTSRASDVGLIRWAARERVDYVALSYVRSAAEIIGLRQDLDGGATRIVAKVETAEAAGSALPEIALAADGILIDRGDLATSIGPEAVQKAVDRVLRFCRTHGRSVWIATGVLPSLQTSPHPTHRDVVDVCHLVDAGASGLVLAEETAIGRFPREAVAVLRVIIAGRGRSSVPAPVRAASAMKGAK